MQNRIVLFLAFICLSLNAVAEKSELVQTRDEIKKTFGLIPSFFDLYPEPGLHGAWEEMKGIILSESAIPAKYKELIGLAVSSQIPCEYCVYFHTQFSKINGATVKQQQEAVAMSALVRQWSTVLNGNQIDYDDFVKEADGMLAYVQDPNRVAPNVQNLSPPHDDIALTFGRVPLFIQAFPGNGIAGAWKVMKALELSDKTSIPPKYKDLIGLAVAAQIPCTYCTYFHTASAKASGATEREIKEAIAVASLTRHWSTVLNGARIDFNQFRKQTDAMVKYVTRKN